MEIRSINQLLLIKNILNNLKDGEKYNKYEIAKASGDKSNFYRSKLLEKLLLNSFLIQKSKDYELKRVLLFAWYEDYIKHNFSIKVPFRW